MAIYTFYLCTRHGTAVSFEAFNLGGDDDAPDRALKLLAEHPSCSYVAVWAGDRRLLTKHREAAVGAGRDQPVGASPS